MKDKKTPKRGTRTNTVPGIKPRVAFESEGSAKENIEKKVHLLLRALKEIELRQDNFKMEVYPLTERQFNLWEMESGDGIRVTKNSRLTLLKYSDLKISAVGAMRILREKRKLSEKKRGREENLAASRRNGLLQKEMRKICERELVKARLQREAALGKLKIVEEQYVSLQKKFSKVSDELQGEIASLKTEISQLVKASRKITGLKRL